MNSMIVNITCMTSPTLCAQIYEMVLVILLIPFRRFVHTNLRNGLGDLIDTIGGSFYQGGSQPIESDYYLKILEEEPDNGISDWKGNTDRNPLALGGCQSTNSFACGLIGGGDSGNGI